MSLNKRDRAAYRMAKLAAKRAVKHREKQLLDRMIQEDLERLKKDDCRNRPS